ncbi:hypothetical protein [Clostridium botulinum]|uniref:hypothetical protein n=1 Tax=Clostridium botulinum TaxID=1491 RepID=UPI000A4247F1|nr:hypothetical protein [Clostridium botulinum]
MGSSFLEKEYRKHGIGSGQYQFSIQLGYVNRVLNPNDKRKYYIYLTDKAKFQKKAF